MKRIVTLLLVLALAGTAATTAFAAQEEAAETITASAADESGPMYITTEGRGQVAVSIDGSEPVFDDEYPMQTATINPSVVDTVILGAKADEGWTFTGWRYADTNKIYSDEETITIEVTETLHLIAVFEEEKDTEPVEESSKPISPAVDTPKTGDTASAIAVSAVLLSSLTAALFLAMKRRKGEQE